MNHRIADGQGSIIVVVDSPAVERGIARHITLVNRQRTTERVVESTATCLAGVSGNRHTRKEQRAAVGGGPALGTAGDRAPGDRQVPQGRRDIFEHLECPVDSVGIDNRVATSGPDDSQAAGGVSNIQISSPVRSFATGPGVHGIGDHQVGRHILDPRSCRDQRQYVVPVETGHRIHVQGVLHRRELREHHRRQRHIDGSAAGIPGQREIGNIDTGDRFQEVNRDQANIGDSRIRIDIDDICRGSNRIDPPLPGICGIGDKIIRSKILDPGPVGQQTDRVGAQRGGHLCFEGQHVLRRGQLLQCRIAQRNILWPQSAAEIELEREVRQVHADHGFREIDRDRIGIC